MKNHKPGAYNAPSSVHLRILFYFFNPFICLAQLSRKGVFSLPFAILEVPGSEKFTNCYVVLDCFCWEVGQPMCLFSSLIMH